MARPESIHDIEVSDVEFGRIDFIKLALDPALLRGYTAFLEAVSKSGATVTMASYNPAVFSRPATLSEMQDQLTSAQNVWDESAKYYEQLAAVGEVEYSYQRSAAERWAEAEGMPFPPEVEASLPLPDGSDAFDAVIRDIDTAIA